MKFAEKYNKNRRFKLDVSAYPYESLVNLYNCYGKDFVYKLTAVFINTKSKFGETPVLATESCLVNAPAYMIDTIKNILSDDDAIRAINDEQVGFMIYIYHSAKYNRDCFGIKFIDIE